MAARAPASEWLDHGAGECPRCGVPYAPLQEYCLECGLRLPEDDGPAGTWAGRGRPAGHAWAWPVLVALVVAVLSLAAVLAARLADDSTAEALIATTGAPPFVPATEPPPVASQPLPTLPTPRPQTTATAQTPKRAPAPRGELVEWPAGRDGWTLVLASYPTATGRETATSRAKAASEAGLPRVGVLDSSEFASLHPGYLVVFSGVYDSQAEAEDALADATSKGYSAAYTREIAAAR
jgi:hypothetical protein